LFGDASAFFVVELAELLVALFVAVEAWSLAWPPHAASVALKKTTVNAATMGLRCICMVSPSSISADVGPFGRHHRDGRLEFC
jgi:hypothetical protein